VPSYGRPFFRMQPHATKRIYTPKSLEFWFQKLGEDWANRFKDSQLEQGRRFYREGQVRELELTTGEAIIHRRVDKRDEYALIEWEATAEGRQRLNVRSSTTNFEEARALAVAGFYEIEELLADEIPAMPREDGDVAEEVPRPVEKKPGSGAESRADRNLLLVFKVQSAGLSFCAFWVDESGKRSPALGASAHAEGAGNGPVTSAERAKLIGLAAYARKAHLHYDQQSGVYLMESLVEIPRFLKTTLPAWEKLFRIELDERAGYLMEGTRSIDIEGVAGVFDSPIGRAARWRPVSTANADVEGINLRWIFRAGEKLLSASEVRALLKSDGQPVILPDFGIVRVAPEKLAAYKSWSQQSQGSQSLLCGEGPQRSQTDLFGGESLPLPPEEKRGGGGIRSLVRQTSSIPPYLVFSLFNDSGLRVTLTPEVEAWRQRVLAVPPPSTDLPEILRPYQRRGVEWMAHLGEVGCHGLLADEMGLGKTLQVITLLAKRPVTPAAQSSDTENGEEATARANPLPSLVVCPASVVPVWEAEIARFAPELCTAVLKAGHDFANDPRGDLVWIASYTQLRKHRDQLASADFGYAVLDEGQFIKNPDAKVTQTCWEIRAQRRLVLTGTPLENRQLDLWSLFRFLLPGLLGTRTSFEAALAADRVGTTERLRAQLAPFILRRTKREVAKELPQKVEIELLCPLSDVQKAEYARTCAEGLERLGDDMATALREKSFGFLALLTRLRQTCCDPDLLPWREAPLSDSGKLMLLIEKLADVIESGRKVVIFSQFVKLLDRVKAALDVHYPLLPRFELTGGTLDRQRPVQEFQTAIGAAAMLVSLKAAGTGITLHAADYVFLLDPWWNPAVEAQAIDRVHRIGQINTVFVYRMVTAGTIEERIQDLKAEKRELFDKLLGGPGGGGDIDLGAHFASLRSLVELGEGAQESRTLSLGEPPDNVRRMALAAEARALVAAEPLSTVGGSSDVAAMVEEREELPASESLKSSRLDLAALAATLPAVSEEASSAPLPSVVEPVSSASESRRETAQQSEFDFSN